MVTLSGFCTNQTNSSRLFHGAASNFAGVCESPAVDIAAPTTHAAPQPSTQSSYWLADIRRQGESPFNPSPANYQVFRNVRNYGAKGGPSPEGRSLYVY